MLRHSVIVPTWMGVLLTALTLIGMALSAYHTSDKAVEARLVKVETKQSAQDDKVDHIQMQVDKLVQWALGGK